MVGHGAVRRGEARLGTVRFGKGGLVRRGVVGHGRARKGGARRGKVGYGNKLLHGWESRFRGSQTRRSWRESKRMLLMIGLRKTQKSEHRWPEQVLKDWYRKGKEVGKAEATQASYRRCPIHDEVFSLEPQDNGVWSAYCPLCRSKESQHVPLPGSTTEPLDLAEMHVAEHMPVNAQPGSRLHVHNAIERLKKRLVVLDKEASGIGKHNSGYLNSQPGEDDFLREVFYEAPTIQMKAVTLPEVPAQKEPA